MCAERDRQLRRPLEVYQLRTAKKARPTTITSGIRTGGTSQLLIRSSIGFFHAKKPGTGPGFSTRRQAIFAAAVSARRASEASTETAVGPVTASPGQAASCSDPVYSTVYWS